MDDWKREFSRAKYYLSRHRPDIALKKLEKALAGCPVSRARDLARVLFFLGITLRKLGLSDSALKSWSAGSRVDRSSSAARMLKRFQNEYGMKRQPTRDQDDWQAFFAIHLNRYIRGKSSLALGTLAERDMVTDLIRERFLLLRNEYALEHLDTGAKYRLFHGVIIVFPRFFPDRPSSEQPIWVDFNKKHRMLPDDTCFCGSGRPFMQCCGRAPGVSELMNGLL
ncbi:MAG: SEC-C domain-containing protein [Spirochaetales bacterium]|nr:SEC-C domain-containing protein [Spirochaetales bacterium]